MEPIIKHFTDDDLYKFTMCCAVIDNFPRAQVRYSFVDRNQTVYPLGFAQALEQQIEYLEQLTITDKEIEFMQRKCYYIPTWFYSYLKGFRFKKEWIHVAQDKQGHLSVEIEGAWSDTILLEVKLLSIISELYYILTGDNKDFDYEGYYAKSYRKAEQLLKAGCVYSEFGTRRRASFKAQDIVMKAFSDCAKSRSWDGRFSGTSNVYLAMKYDLTPIGTMAHEFVCAIGAMYGPQMANHIAMNAWRNTFRGALGQYLYDTFGWQIFALNFSEDFANLFKGLRIDSGDDIEQLHLIVEKYNSFGIDPKSKEIIFSNGLSTQKAITLHKYARHYCRPCFGIGTHFTNDFTNVLPMNIVIKLVAAKITEAWPFYNDTCKLSEDKGKHTGKSEVIQRFKEALHWQTDSKKSI